MHDRLPRSQKSHLEHLVVNWIKGLFLYVRLLLGFFVAIWKEVHLYVRVRNSISVHSGEASSSDNLQVEGPIIVLDANENLSTDLVVAFLRATDVHFQTLQTQACINRCKQV